MLYNKNPFSYRTFHIALCCLYTQGDVSEVDANNEDQGQSCYEDDNPELIQIPSDEDFENEITESGKAYHFVL